MTVRSELHDLFTFRPSPVRWPVALQAAFAMGLPVTVFTLVGQPQLGLLASTGGFTALYLANRSRRFRARILPLFAVGLVAASALGVASSGSVVVSLVVLFAVTAVSGVLTLGFGVGPPGPLFFMLVTGVSVRLAAPVALDGVGIDGGLVVGMTAVGCVTAYLVVLAPLIFASVRARDRELHSTNEPMAFSITEDTRVILFRLTLASAIAVILAAPLGVHRTYWVLLTVIAILQNGRRLRLTAVRAIHRVAGTFVGLGLFAAIMFLRPAGLWIALILAGLQFIVELVVIRNYGLALVFITPLALTIAAQGDPGDIGTIVVTRVVDTCLGGAIALVILLIALAVRRIRAR